MKPVKVVLANDDDSSERELGPFNQGVALERHGDTVRIIDIASREAIAQTYGDGFVDDEFRSYERIFIQAVA